MCICIYEYINKCVSGQVQRTCSDKNGNILVITSFYFVALYVCMYVGFTDSM